MEDRHARNLNPTPEAVLAMAVWGDAYGKQKGGSMDFWDSLPQPYKNRMTNLLERVEEAQLRHRRIPKPDREGE